MRRNGFTFVEFVVVLIIVGILASILFPTFNRNHETSPRAQQCQSNLKQIGLAMLLYSQDYHDKFPPLSNAHAGFWAGSIQPYLKSWQLFQCPSTKGNQLKRTDYFYNSRLQGLNQDRILSTAKTVLMGDGKDDAPLNTALPNIPLQWSSEETSPLNRHQDRANYLFVDGHVKRLLPGQIEEGTANGTKYSFAIQ